VAHAAWASVCIVVCLLLVVNGRQGHPPAIILLPVVLLAGRWARFHSRMSGGQATHGGSGRHRGQRWFAAPRRRRHLAPPHRCSTGRGARPRLRTPRECSSRSHSWYSCCLGTTLRSSRTRSF
jgi:hypothetical protein